MSAKTFTFAASGLAIVAVTYGLARYSFGLFIPEITKELALTPNVLGFIASSSYIGFLLSTLTAAWLSNRFSPRFPIMLGGLCAALGMLIVANAPNSSWLIIGIFIAGTSPGFAYPPFSELILNRIEAEDQDKTYAWINSGTGFGVALMGPIVLFSAFEWRTAYTIFAVLAVLAVISSWFTASTKEASSAQMASARHNQPKGKRNSFMAIIRLEGASSILLVAFFFGLVCSIYWTYAVDLLFDPGEMSNIRAIYWTVIGAAGMLGFAAGPIVGRFGLRPAYRVLFVITGIAVGSLPFIAGNNLAIMISAAIFGLGFIISTAFLGMWAMRTFAQAPATGFAIVFFLISLGQAVGPLWFGHAMYAHVSIDTLFLICGILCVILALISPPKAEFCPKLA